MIAISGSLIADDPRPAGAALLLCRHLWLAAKKAGGLRLVDTMEVERQHKFMAHLPYRMTSKMSAGLERRMIRHIVRALHLKTAALRRAPSPAKAPLRVPAAAAAAAGDGDGFLGGAVKVSFTCQGGQVIHGHGGVADSCEAYWIRRRAGPRHCKCGQSTVGSSLPGASVDI